MSLQIRGSLRLDQIAMGEHVWPCRSDRERGQTPEQRPSKIAADMRRYRDLQLPTNSTPERYLLSRCLTFWRMRGCRVRCMPTFVLRLIAPRPDFAQTMTDAEREIMNRHAAHWRP